MSSQRNMTDMLKRRGRKSSPTQHSNTELVNFDVLSLSGMSERGVQSLKNVQDRLQLCSWSHCMLTTAWWILVKETGACVLDQIKVNHKTVDFAGEPKTGATRTVAR